MPINPLATVAAVLTPLALAGVFAVGAYSKILPDGAASGPRSQGGARPAAPVPRPEAPLVKPADEIEPGVVQIVSRSGDADSFGTGFVLDAAKGYVVTNAHVVSGVSAIKAVAGQTEMSARLVATAPCDDIAVLQVSALPADARALPLADSASVQREQHVRAFGFPADLDIAQMSVTDGRVSATGVAGAPGGDLPNFASTIQHQAPINPGNSGGPLVDDEGRVVGVNTLSSSANEGESYSISADHLKSVLPGLLEGHSKDEMGWTLTQAQAVTFDWHGENAESYRTAIAEQDLGGYMYADHVEPGSPAAEAGVAAGDLITHVEGSPVQSFGDICDVVQSRGPGQTVSLSALAVDRAGADPLTQLDPMALTLR